MSKRNAYHVTIASLFPGDVIRPERHAALYRQFRPGGPMPAPDFIANLLWELALEAARAAGAPNKPSRLASVYAWETLEAARLFRERRGPEAAILAVEFGSDAPLHRGDFDLISSGNPTTAYVDYMSETAARYWLDPPVGIVVTLPPTSIQL
ncbi:hypothetical protein MWN33_09960 [Starkeya koreensis]|uniref:Uncharacterized protein n=1 Tax=Ancylobacter koreensis TaxID=266121 RepID=A0ABT0DM67_9HYPH|nr:hypothetical protein [Ancylobacter koreensis]MCK0208355.1 hypothetical protein [Ancylobacter koreensis]